MKEVKQFTTSMNRKVCWEDGYKKAIKDIIKFMQIEGYPTGNKEYDEGFEWAEKYYIKQFRKMLKKE